MRLVADNTESTYSFGMPDGERAADQCLRLSVIAAGTHFERGEFQAGITALCDSLWISHSGRHEQVSDLDMLTAIRRIGGFGWAPPEDRA